MRTLPGRVCRGAAATIGLAAAIGLTASAAAGAAPGDLDPTFGSGGIATANGALSLPNALTLQPDGRIVVVGNAIGSPGFDWGVVRFTPSGAPDVSFGSGGRVTTDFGGDYDYAADVALQPDGRIMVAGVEGDDSGLGRDFALARYNADGRLDATFGSAGRVTTDIAGDVDDAMGVVLQPDGRIVVAGSASTRSGGRDFAVARYLPNGGLDATFGASGVVTRNLLGNSDFVGDVALQSDGRIVVAGASGGDFAVLRFNADGSADTGFGFGGVALTDFGGGLAFGYAVALQRKGRIVVTGPTQALDFALALYKPNGGLDARFGFDGRVITDFAGDDDISSAVAVQSDGRIVAAGLAASAHGDDAFDEDFALARYDKHGRLDPTFGVDGKVTTDAGGGNDGAEAVALQADGKIVAAGGPRFTVVRYLGRATPR